MVFEVDGNSMKLRTIQVFKLIWMQSGKGKPSLYWSFCSSLESIWPQESSRHKSFPWKMVLDPLFSRLLFVCNGHKAPAVGRWAGWGSVIQVSELIRAHLNRSTMQTPNNLRLQQTKVLIFQFHVFQSMITKSSTMNQWNSHQFRVKAAAADFATSETTPVMPLIRSKLYWGPFRRLMSEIIMENWREKSRAKKLAQEIQDAQIQKKTFHLIEHLYIVNRIYDCCFLIHHSCPLSS